MRPCAQRASLLLIHNHSIAVCVKSRTVSGTQLLACNSSHDGCLLRSRYNSSRDGYGDSRLLRSAVTGAESGEESQGPRHKAGRPQRDGCPLVSIRCVKRRCRL